MLQKLWARLDTRSRVALGIGLALAVISIPLPYWLALLIGAVLAVLVGFAYPDRSARLAVLVVLPIMIMAFVFGLLRGIGAITMLVLLLPSLIAPVVLARVGASVRVGEVQ